MNRDERFREATIPGAKLRAGRVRAEAEFRSLMAKCETDEEKIQVFHDEAKRLQAKVDAIVGEL